VKHVFRYVIREPVEPGGTLLLSDIDSKHLVRVVRRAEGAGILLIDLSGHLWPATVVEVGSRVKVVVAEEGLAGLPPAPLVLYQGLAEWGRLDMLTEKVAELGVAEMALMVSERVRRVPAPDAWRRRKERLGRVVEAAARQAGRGHLTRIRGLVSFDDVVREIPPGEGFLLDPGSPRSLADVLADAGPSLETVRIVVGPDTGFSDVEVQRAREAGIATCSIGPATLRAETAALVSVVQVLGTLGALSPARGAVEGLVAGTER
jgi:16S rRNA (uracil1498-N3)-methyltransferase